MDSYSNFKAIAELIHHVRTDQQIKLRFGANKRQEIKAALEAGTPPDHYRLRWLYNTRDELAKWLSAQAKEFNRQYPHDACSVSDLIDVCSSTLILLRKANNSKD